MIRDLARRLAYPVPAHLRARQRKAPAAALDAVERSIRENYHVGWRSESKYSPAEYSADLADHLHRRLENDRTRVVPWLDAARPLEGTSILELGCGTGSSTLALAEQGAKVVGVDIDEGALVVGRDRCAAYGVAAEFVAADGVRIESATAGRKFDVVIFFACLEHMTVRERLESLRAAWRLLPAGGLLVVTDTPNRLWYFDNHTSDLPFFNWLPDEVAYHYSAFSPRENFAGLYTDFDDARSHEHFLRRGRGVSYHELDIAIGPSEKLDVVSSLSTFRPLAYLLRSNRAGRRHRSLLRRVRPDLHPAFMDEYLDVIIRK